MSNQYKTTGLAHYYQLLTTLNNLRQDSGQSVNDFLATIQPIWDQLAQDTISDDHLHLIQVLMALRPEYESVRAALLHRHPLPTLDGAIKELLFEETRLGLIKPFLTDVALATTTSHSLPSSRFCKNCRSTGHIFSACPTVECRYCHGRGHILENCPTRPPRPKGNSKKTQSFSKPGSTSVAAATAHSSSPITISDLDTLLKQVISPSSSTSAAFSATPGVRYRILRRARFLGQVAR
nr:retrovirus-related Pol polyprotein from transposon TNT 1-94 [Ipomoea batatas]